jgi:hypothetical protein
MLPVANTAGMIEHLSLISQATAKDRQALVIVDRAGRVALALALYL